MYSVNNEFNTDWCLRMNRINRVQMEEERRCWWRGRERGVGWRGMERGKAGGSEYRRKGERERSVGRKG